MAIPVLYFSHVVSQPAFIEDDLLKTDLTNVNEQRIQ